MEALYVWSLCSKSNLDEVIKMQKRAARVILDTDRRAKSIPLFNKLKWLLFNKLKCLPFYEEAIINRHC